MRQKQFKCEHCHYIFPIKFANTAALRLFRKLTLRRQKGLKTVPDFKCPKCGKFTYGIPATQPNWVECYKCIYRDECETREMRDGCYLGEEE